MTQTDHTAGRTATLSLLVAAAATVAALLWSYWTTLGEMAHRWARDPQYSHGYLVPGFCLVLLWLRREHLARGPVGVSWLGVPLLAFGLAVRLVGAFYYFVWLDAISILPVVAGLFLLLGGWTALRWSWPAVLFLGFMVPLPHRVSVSCAEPLQRFATSTSTYLLQTLGFPAIAEGNVILLDNVELGIVEACSGLRMLVIFFALSTGFVLLVRRPLWEKLFIAASALPIALVVNVIRITVTGILYQVGSSETAHAVFHDLAGWLMMPMALGLLAVELWLLKSLLLDPEPEAGPAPVA
jgi:exosortase